MCIVARKHAPPRRAILRQVGTKRVLHFSRHLPPIVRGFTRYSGARFANGGGNGESPTLPRERKARPPATMPRTPYTGPRAPLMRFENNYPLGCIPPNCISPGFLKT